MRTAEIEKRLAAVEQEVAHLKAQRLPSAPAHPVHALEKIHGIFEDDAAFQEAARLGRKWRDSQRPNARKTTAKRK